MRHFYPRTIAKSVLIDISVIRSAIRGVLLTGMLVLPYSSDAQNVPQDQGSFTSDRSIKPPVFSGAPGRKDPTAIAEIAAHVAAVGAAPWTGFQASGTIEYGPKGGTPYTAKLTNMGSDRFRLDAQSDKGLTSVRIDRRQGKSQIGDQPISILPIGAALEGLFPFELLRTPLTKAAMVSVLDRGMVSIGGKQLHCISIGIPATGRIPSTKLRETMVMDFYLDPDTHLLLKSVALLPVTGDRGSKLLDVVSYSDYRASGTSLIPYSFTETLEGERSLRLQLADVQLNPNLPAAYFEF